MMSSPQLAEEVAEALAAHLDHVIICPGSRNSPLSLALLAREDIRVHTRIDERSAAFLALGMARVLRRPVGVLTTSGTAVANCLPAMTEAAHAHVPLVMISADRPERLVGTGANQTIVQRGLFEPVATSTQITQNNKDVRGAVDEAFARPQVHLNVAFDTPLVAEMPERSSSPRGRWPLPEWVDRGEVEIDLSKRTLVIAGDEAWEVPGLEDVPTIAEPSAPAPFHPVHPLAASLLAMDTQVLRPEQIVVVGHPTLHREVMELAASPDIELFVLSRSEQVTNPWGREAQVASRVKVTGEIPARWLEVCEAASSHAAEAVRGVLEEDFGFTGLHVAAAVADTLAVGDYLFLGASNPVRDASLVGLPFDGVSTLSPRGTAGIDGSVSQAVGMALAAQSLQPEEPRAPRCLALLGDVTFLHDVGGLLVGPDSPSPEDLTVVVANDDGGGIFSTLEVGQERYAEGFERAFGTPHGVEIADLASAYGLEHRQVDTLEGLIEALLDAQETPGFRIIEARTRRDTRRRLHERLAAAVAV